MATYDIKLVAVSLLFGIYSHGRWRQDSVAATVIRTSDPDPQDGDAPTLTGALIGTYRS